MLMNKNELIEHINHTISCLATDYDTVYEQTRFFLEQPLTKQQKMDLQWGLTRLHTDTYMLIESFKRLREYVKGRDTNVP